MEIIAEDDIEKAVMVPGKTTDAKQPWKTKYEVIDDNYFQQSDVKFAINSPLNLKKSTMLHVFTPVEVKQSIQQFGLEHGLFSQIVKNICTLLAEAYKYFKKPK